ncbi:MAG: ABC-2 family transporter protein [Spirochaetales bacterium]|nr:ABC-2 family transporter protein [Spirochaetales bacterium]
MIRILKILKTVAFVTFKEWSAYRSHVLVSLFVGPVLFLTQYFICRAIFSTGNAVAGFSFEQLVSYFALTICINYLIYDSAGWNIQMLVRTGLFLTFMLRPVNHRFFALSQKVGHRILGFVLEFIPVYLVFTFIFRITLIPVYPGWFMLSLVLSFIMAFLFNYSTGLLAFWLTRTEGVRRIFLVLKDILSGVFLPLNFFPRPVQLVLFFLPFQFINYVPVRVFLGSYNLAGMEFTIPQIVGIQALATFAVFLLSEWLYRVGIKRFTGVGA